MPHRRGAAGEDRQYGVTRSLMYLFVGYTPRGAEPHTGGTGHEDYPLDWDRRSRGQVDHRAFQGQRRQAGQGVRTEAGHGWVSEADQVLQRAGWRGADRVRSRAVRVRDVTWTTPIPAIQMLTHRCHPSN